MDYVVTRYNLFHDRICFAEAFRSRKATAAAHKLTWLPPARAIKFCSKDCWAHVSYKQPAVLRLRAADTPGMSPSSAASLSICWPISHSRSMAA